MRISYKSFIDSLVLRSCSTDKDVYWGVYDPEQHSIVLGELVGRVCDVIVGGVSDVIVGGRVCRGGL